MARKPRLEWKGASYHVMARGNERARIFKGKADYELFIQTLEQSIERFGISLHGWVLMPNHYHLALSTPKANLSRWMAWLQTTFTARYNHRYRRTGHLYQGRYRAEIVDSEAYARHLMLYIHLNPIRTRQGGQCEFKGGMAELDKFAWSSHLDLSKKRKKPLVKLSLDWEHYWSQKQAEVPRNYLKAVLRALKARPEDWKMVVENGLVAGGGRLLEEVMEKLKAQKNRESALWRKPVEREKNREKMESMLESEPDRAVVSWVRVRLLGEKGVEVAQKLGYQDGSGVTYALRRVERQRKESDLMKNKLKPYLNYSIFKG
jgi:putative transposase